MKIHAKRWILLVALLLSIVAIGTAIAARYQSNVINRTYFVDPLKINWAGHGLLLCPSSNNEGWMLLDGVETPYFTDTLGPACPTGPNVECPLCF